MYSKKIFSSFRLALKSPNINGALVPTGFISCVFSTALYRDLISSEFDRICLLAAGTLTIMMSITALLYSRAQGSQMKSRQRRSFFAAEQCFAGTILFGITFVVAVTVVMAVYLYTDSVYSFGLIDWVIMTIIPIKFIFSAFFKFLYGLRVAIHHKPWDQHPKKFLSQLKRKWNLTALEVDYKSSWGCTVISLITNDEGDLRL